MKTLSIIILAALLTATWSQAHGGDKVSVRSLGMGRSAVASTRGTDAIGVNPANLALPDGGQIQISLAPTSLNASTELFTYDSYRRYFTGVDTGGNTNAPKYLNTTDKQSIRNQMSNLPVTLINIESMIAGFSFRNSTFGGIGFGIIEHAGGTVAFAKDYIDLLFLEGLQQNRKYILDGTSVEAWWYREYNISYGRKLQIQSSFLKDLEAGVSLKLIHGYGIYTTTQNQGYIDNPAPASDTSLGLLVARINFATKHAGVNFFNAQSGESFTPFPDPAGTGIGFDIGFSGELNNGVRIALSVTDIGSIRWDENIMETWNSGSFDYAGFDLATKDSLDNIFKGESRTGEAFSTSLPTVLHVGAMADAKNLPFLNRIPGHLMLSFEYAQGFNQMFGNTTKARFSLGAEYQFIPVLVLRTGMMLGGTTGFHWACGVGLDFKYLSLDIATDNFGMLFANNQSYAISAGAGLKIKF